MPTRCLLLWRAHDEVRSTPDRRRRRDHAADLDAGLDDSGASPQRDELANCETLADLALRSAHAYREAGDDARADEYEHNAEAFANRAIRLRHEIEELEGRERRLTTSRSARVGR